MGFKGEPSLLTARKCKALPSPLLAMVTSLYEWIFLERRRKTVYTYTQSHNRYTLSPYISRVDLPVLQVSPLYPGSHVQENPSDVSRQVPWTHGLLLQSITVIENNIYFGFYFILSSQYVIHVPFIQIQLLLVVCK